MRVPINEAMAQAKRAKWVRYIERIEPQVFRMMDFRRWNRVYEEIVNANPRLHPGIPVLDYFRHVYADYAALAVRRQSKPHDDAISLLELIEDMAKFPEALTLEWTVEVYSRPTPSGHVYDAEMARDLAELTFKKYADTSGLIFDGTIAAADADRLRAATSKIVGFVDSTIAHDDKQLPTEFSTFDELDAAIVLIAELTKKYSLLLTGASFGTMTPIDQTNAIGVFSFPWIDPEHPPDLKGRSL
jgi:hypothetical protein